MILEFNMLLRTLPRVTPLALQRVLMERPQGTRSINMAATAATQPKREGDISDAFASLSKLQDQPLPDSFRQLKLHLAHGNETALQASWVRLLDALRHENDTVASQGPAIIPEIEYERLATDLPAAVPEIRKRGVVVIRGVIPEAEARAYKTDLLEGYLRANPQTRGFPAQDPQVWELYWSAAQLRARTHPRFLEAATALMQATWHSSDAKAPVSLGQPLTYADRLRIRRPGDQAFALGPHQDGGSVERWMDEGYGRGGTYEAVFRGRWEDEYDPWEASTRVDAVNDLFGGLGACTMFRMFQGWLSMSEVGPREGTLLVNPLLKLATAYSLLRPFFRPVTETGVVQMPPASTPERARFLAPENWAFTGGEAMTSEMPGATPGFGMEFPQVILHPHLELDRTMVHVPRVKPGDYVAWHCDTIHAVDGEHKGTGDSSVLYIPISPITEINADYVKRARAAWRAGTPGPDFPGGKGESEHVGRPTEDFVRSVTNQVGLASMGLEPLAVPGEEVTEGERAVVGKVNQLLGFGMK